MPIRRADDTTYALAAAASATGASVSIRGGEYLFIVDGTVSGATISLQIQAPSGAWADVQVFTGSVVKFTTLPGSQTGVDLPACNVRMAATGGTPSGLNASLVGLG
jgi:hypothetical protein